MTDWTTVATFGRPSATLPLLVRPSAYALIRNSSGRLALVQTPRGSYLPGGGCDPGEKAEDTIHRETLEETGLRIMLGDWRCHAIEHVTAASEGASFEKRSTFGSAVMVGEIAPTSEADHQLVWAAPADARTWLTSESHRWAVMEWMTVSRHFPDPLP